MPRQARLDAPGVLHQVMVRGIEKRRIVDDAKDRRRFVARLGDAALSKGMTIYAWSLMGNHAHILLRTGPVGLPSFMRGFRKVGIVAESHPGLGNDQDVRARLSAGDGRTQGGAASPDHRHIAVEGMMVESRHLSSGRPFPEYLARSLGFSIFPVGLLGTSSKMTRRGRL
jgi:hypothetical protein